MKLLAILFGLLASSAFAQTMPQQQNCTTTTSGSIAHTFCGPPVVVQVQASPPPAVNITVVPAPVTVQQAPPAVKTDPKPKG